MFVDNALFPWLPAFERNWTVIRAELEGILGEAFSPWPETQFYNFGWEVFPLYGWSVRLDRNCEKVPETARLIESIPGVLNAGFSRMAPKTHIRPHRGWPEGLLRLHVPLIIPGDCLFRVDEQTREWTEGECFVFDDCHEHEAWNNSDSIRIVLLVDFPAHDLVTWRPKPRKVESFVKRVLGKPLEYTYLDKAS